MIKLFLKNLKKEYKIFLLLNVICFFIISILFFIFKDLFLLGFTLIVFVLIDLFTLFSFISKEKEVNKKMIMMFISLVDYLQIHINYNHNFFDAINKYNDAKSLKFNEILKTLLDAIKEDKTFTPFISFAKNFSIGRIEPLLFSIYQISLNQNIENICYFNEEYKLFKSDLEIKYKVIYDNDKNINLLKSSALISSAIIIILIILITILIVGEFIRV